MFRTSTARRRLLLTSRGADSCERYVVVTRAASQYVGNQSIYGLGVVNSGSPVLTTIALHAVVRIHVHDGHTFAV